MIEMKGAVRMKFAKDIKWLLKNINEKNVRIVDCRFSLLDPQKGKSEYQKSHIPGAVFFDLEQDLSAAVQEHGGRHPLPNLEEFAGKLEKAGIGDNIAVIAYDAGEGAFAARFWWLLHYLGHNDVYVLDGGYQGWLEGNHPVNNEIPVFEKAELQIFIRNELLATVEEVKQAVNKKDKILIDSRELNRYLGLQEPIDKKAGHLPGAINKPWQEGFINQRYKSSDEQRQRFSELKPDQEIIVYCGSGVTAVPNFLSLTEAGFKHVKLYAGSFSDWISYPENKIE